MGGWGVLYLVRDSIQGEKSSDVPRVDSPAVRDRKLEDMALVPTCCGTDHLAIQASRGTLAPEVQVAGLRSGAGSAYSRGS